MGNEHSTPLASALRALVGAAFLVACSHAGDVGPFVTPDAVSSIASSESGASDVYQSAEFGGRRGFPRSVPVSLCADRAGKELAAAWPEFEEGLARVAVAWFRDGAWREVRVPRDGNTYTAPICMPLGDGTAALAWGGPSEGKGLWIAADGAVLDRVDLDLRPERLSALAASGGVLLGGARSAARFRAWNPLVEPHGSTVRVQRVPTRLHWARDGVGGTEDMALDRTHDHTPAVVTGAGTVYGRDDGRSRFEVVWQNAAGTTVVARDVGLGVGEWLDAATDDAGGPVVCYVDEGRVVVLARRGLDWSKLAEISSAEGAMGVRVVAMPGKVHVCWWRFERDGPRTYLVTVGPSGPGERTILGRAAGAALTRCGSRAFVAMATETSGSGPDARHRIEVLPLPE